MIDVPKDAENAILEALYEGKTVIAWKLYNDATRVGLTESKRFVLDLDKNLRRQHPERFRGPGSINIMYILQAIEFSMVTGNTNLQWDDVDDIVQALTAGKKDEALKRYQELTGQSLEDARKAIDAVEGALRGEPEVRPDQTEEPMKSLHQADTRQGEMPRADVSVGSASSLTGDTGCQASRWTILWRLLCRWIEKTQRRMR